MNEKEGLVVSSGYNSEVAVCSIASLRERMTTYKDFRKMSEDFVKIVVVKGYVESRSERLGRCRRRNRRR